jgi:Protein of unknown function (DUF3105)
VSSPYDQRRPTKAERKEQARLEREAIQRQMAASKRNRTIGLSLVALAAVAVIVAVIVLQPGASDGSGQPAPADLLTQAAAAAEAAGCSEVQTTGDYPGGADGGGLAHDQYRQLPPPLDTYPSTPPASGPHADFTLPAGVYDSPPDMGSVIHSLEHGGSVVWYSPDAPADQIDAIEAFYGQDDPVGQDRVIVAPYDYDEAAGQLPDGVQMALVAWHRLQTCAAPSLEVAFDFTSQYSAPTSQDREYLGEAPEAGGVM